MLAYIFKRILLMVPTLLGVLLLTFVVIQFVQVALLSSIWQRLKQAWAQVLKAVVWLTVERKV